MNEVFIAFVELHTGMKTTTEEQAEGLLEQD